MDSGKDGSVAVGERLVRESAPQLFRENRARETNFSTGSNSGTVKVNPGPLRALPLGENGILALMRLRLGKAYHPVQSAASIIRADWSPETCPWSLMLSFDR